MEVTLKIQLRTPGKADLIRKKGLAPAVLYGKGHKNVLFTVDHKTIRKIIESPYAHILFNLENGS